MSGNYDLPRCAHACVGVHYRYLSRLVHMYTKFVHYSIIAMEQYC